MSITELIYPDLIEAPRVFRARGALSIPGLSTVNDVTVEVAHSNSGGLAVSFSTVGGIPAAAAHAGVPGQPLPPITFSGESHDGNWLVEISGIGIWSYNVGNGASATVAGSAQKAIAKRKAVAVHMRTLVGFGDVVIPAQGAVNRRRTEADGTIKCSMQTLLVSLPTEVGKSAESRYLHNTYHQPYTFVRTEKRNSNPVLTTFLVETDSAPRDPFDPFVSRLRSMIRFASAGSCDVLCVYNIDSSEKPYELVYFDAPSSVCVPSFAALPMLNHYATNLLKDFLAKSMGNWPIAEKLGIDLAMHFVMQSFQSPSLEVRFANLSIAFEVMTSHHAQATGFSKDHKSSLPKKSFPQLLKELSASYGNGWVPKTFVDIRNSIVHAGVIPAGKGFPDFADAVAVFHEIVLRAVGYSGIYNDVRTFSDATI